MYGFLVYNAYNKIILQVRSFTTGHRVQYNTEEVTSGSGGTDSFYTDIHIVKSHSQLGITQGQNLI